MINLNEMILTIKDLKNELAEACEKSVGLTGKALEMNLRHRENLVNEILRIESITREEVARYKKDEITKKLEKCVLDEQNKEEIFGQEKLVFAFRQKLKEIKTKYANASTKEISDNQRQTILSGMKDRIGLDVDQDIIKFVIKFNYEQASQVIKVLSNVSFKGQREMLTNAVKTMKNRDGYDEIVREVMVNINKRVWFDANKDLLTSINELQPPTEAQVRRIANVAKYVETAYTLRDFDLDIQDYEVRVVKDGQEMPYYTMNWDLFKKDIEDRMNRESASNFIQTWDYLSNQYEGRNLEQHERSHLRSLYIQLGDYELTRPSHLNTILKENYNFLVSKLEYAVQLNKAVNNSANSKFREEMSKTKVSRIARETREVKLSQEQEDARDLYNFVRNIYAVIGQNIPTEMRAILPDSYSQNREAVYIGIEEENLPTFRKLVFEQRRVIKETYVQYSSNDSKHVFNWGAFVANQPESVLIALGLNDLM